MGVFWFLIGVGVGVGMALAVRKHNNIRLDIDSLAIVKEVARDTGLTPDETVIALIQEAADEETTIIKPSKKAIKQKTKVQPEKVQSEIEFSKPLDFIELEMDYLKSGAKESEAYAIRVKEIYKKDGTYYLKAV